MSWKIKLRFVQVLLTPGSYYEPWLGKDKTSTEARGAEKGIGNFRLAYSLTTVSLPVEVACELIC